MKTAVLCGIVLAAAASAAAQIVATPPPHTMTLTGCVSAGSKTRGITLSNALVLPGDSTPPTPAPGDVASPPPPAAAETPAPPRAVGTTGTVAGTAPAGSSASSIGGYRLSGVDMASWVGRRVQLVGTLVSSPTASSGAPAVAAPAPDKAALAMPEFRVSSVQPITGPCPQR